MMHLGRKAMVAALAASTLMVAGCATETTYRPATGQGFNRTGYSERRIEPDRFIVSFAGNSVTSRDTVERYLFFRAAELTLQNGYDYFVMADRDTDRQTRTYTTPGFGYGGFGGYWGPAWRYYGRGFGWRTWDPWFGGFGPWDNGFDIRQIDRYEATAEIVMRKGPIPRDNLRAFNARAVIDSIGPSVVLPKAN
ncbi:MULTISPECIES: CC0125/CC1285 family lipoprotein [unclassified Sphingomonas]|uniref:CC0125/CC1285 family lipoprotein n=1 Tax=unclassified Sphingomonas TaxID=196159 RepID=UPI000E106B8F|nr:MULTISPECIES: hypothetical protein [unclassified Sphingomonas]AXJ96179.1 hypothetical protein DM480_12395 [Sphingomonas sp. FARSPH]